MASVIDTLQVKFEALGSDFERSMGSMFGPRSVLATAGKVAGGAMLAAGAAIAGFATKGTAEFQKVDTLMREVFTLLPGITQDAMDGMTAEVLDFSREFGKLPEEVIPALYQALSAGVPKDNVFEFLETANQAATGGVSDLETAVDALTSITNAYGLETISTQEASDLLFTTIRLGKTNMDELAAVVSRVTPIASSLGIGFDEVSAAMAALTATGVPTAEAATQLRGLFAELTDSSKGAGQAFANISGVSFPEFIAGGGTVEEALIMMSDKAAETGMRVGDSFGSIEAGMAATVLSSESGAVLFGNAMDAMGDSSGATQTAFETMDSGIQASWNRLKANFNVLTVEVGEKLAPMFKTGVDAIVDTIMPALSTAVLGVFDAIEGAAAWVTTQLDKFKNDTDGSFAAVRGIAESMGSAVGAVFDTLKTLWTIILKPAWDAIQPYIELLWPAVEGIIGGALKVIEGLFRVLTSFLEGDWAAAWDGMKLMLEGVMDAIEAVIKLVWDGLKLYFGDTVDSIKEKLEASWNAIKTALTGIWDGIAAAAGTAWAGVVAAIEGAFNGLTTFFEGVWEGVIGAVRDAVNKVIGFVNAMIDAWNGIKFSGGGQVLIARQEIFGKEIMPEIRLPAFSFGVPAIPNIPQLAEGGIVLNRTLALVGESGPEAVVPLDRFENMLNGTLSGGRESITINVELDGRAIMRAVAPRLVDEIRLKTGVIGV